MKVDLLYLLCRWSPMFVWLMAMYYELKELLASHYRQEEESVTDNEAEVKVTVDL